MKYTIAHTSSRRIRLHVAAVRMTTAECCALEYTLKQASFVTDAAVYEATCDAVVFLESTAEDQDALFRLLDAFTFDSVDPELIEADIKGRELNRYYRRRLIFGILRGLFRRLFLPLPIRIALTVISSLPFLAKGARSLLQGRIDVSVLDAAAITASMVRGDFGTAASVMVLLRIGDLLEEWTYRKSVSDLAKALSLKSDKVWMKTTGDDVLMNVSEIREGDRIVVRTGGLIPLDGRVISGCMTVNQSALTGESVPVEKMPGGYAYAGTVVEEGECVLEVTKAFGHGKYDQIAAMIEESGKLKSRTEAKAYHLADSLAPYSLFGSAATWLLTGNAEKALSFLMVDFSCALKLSMPLAVLSAIREAEEFGISVKGAKFLEAVAEADTCVFDKTGTLTNACPVLVDLITFDGADATECLRLAACLEEHYPHTIANAVVEGAKKRGITHDEVHTDIQYVVAHGIASLIGGERALIGSYHFIFEDEGCVSEESEREKLDAIPTEYTHLYLAVSGRLKAVLCIFDPLREEAADTIRGLRELGITRICMITGDNRHTADAVAASLDLDCCYSEVLPSDKAGFIRKEQAAGRKVLMVGDGVNDAPALSEADAGIALNSGSAIAKEISDIMITSGSLRSLLTLRRLSMVLMKRIRNNYRFTISFNAFLIALGAFGVLPSSVSALLHNTSTIVSGLNSMTPLLGMKEEIKSRDLKASASDEYQMNTPMPSR